MAKNRGIEQSLAVQEERPVRAALYVRVSSEEQKEAQTIENQIRYGQDFAKLNGIEIADIYRDDAVSGTVPFQDRSGGRRLLEDARAKRFTVVLTYRVDRIARKTVILLNCHEILDALGIRIRSMTEPFDTATPIGEFMITMLASMAALERDTIMERTSLGRKRKLELGQWAWGGKPPLGYGKGPQGSLEVVPREAEIVKEVFRLYTQENYSMARIADYLNATGVPGANELRGSGKKCRWAGSQIGGILSSPAYMGLHKHEVRTGQETQEVTLHGPAIVSEEEWHQAEKTRRMNERLSPRNTKAEYLLRGLIKCGLCNSTYAGYSAGKHFYYHCMGRLSKRNECHAKIVRADNLNNLVWDDIRGFVMNPGPVLEELKAKLESERDHQPDFAGELAELDKACQTKGTERQRVIRLHRIGIIDEQEAEGELSALQREVDTLEWRRAELFGQERAHLSMASRLSVAESLLGSLRDKIEKATFETKRQLVMSLVDKVTVDTIEESGRRAVRIRIEYCFSNPNDRALDRRHSGNDPGGDGNDIVYCITGPFEEDLTTIWKRLEVLGVVLAQAASDTLVPGSACTRPAPPPGLTLALPAARLASSGGISCTEAPGDLRTLVGK